MSWQFLLDVFRAVMITLPDMHKPLEKAIEQAGGLRELGRKLGISHQAIHQWVRVPAERVLTVERITGVSRHALRPDIYPRESK